MKAVHLDFFLKISGVDKVFVSVHPGDKNNFQLYRPIWLGNLNYEQSLALTQKDDRCLGLIRKITPGPENVRISYAVLVRTSNFDSVRPILLPEQKDKPFISSRRRFLVSPLPVGTSKEEVSDILRPLSWPCRPLVAADTFSWIVGAEEPPSKTYISYLSQDVAITPLQPDIQTRFPSSSASAIILQASPSDNDKAVKSQIAHLTSELEALKKQVLADQKQKSSDIKKLATSFEHQKTDMSQMRAEFNDSQIETNKRIKTLEDTTEQTIAEVKAKFIEQTTNFEVICSAKVEQARTDILGEMSRNQIGLLAAVEALKRDFSSDRRARSPSKDRTRNPDIRSSTIVTSAHLAHFVCLG
jgi:hypothetical protein